MPSGTLNTAYLYPVNTAEIISTFLSRKNSKSTDVDDVQIAPVKHVIDIVAPTLERIINVMFISGIFPRRLQIAKVSTIFKGGDKNNLSNFRPISILPVFSKGIEKLSHCRMTSFLTKHKIITPFQFGFTKGRSTESALLLQKEIILSSFEREQYTLGIFIDYSKAFDRINHTTLIKKLAHYGFRGIFLALLESYLEHRKQYVTTNGFSSN